MRPADVVVVGGGPSGITTALAAARAAPAIASRLVVLEARTYPREKICAGAVGGRGDAILRALDASPVVPSVPIDGISVRLAEGEVSARVGGIGRVVKRAEFDAELARVATRRGLRVEESSPVLAIEPIPGGARVVTARGTIDAAVVVGADGVGGIVRRSMGLPRGGMRAQVIEVDTETVAGDGDRATVHFDGSDRRYSGYAWDFPTIVGGEPKVCRGIYHLTREGEDVEIGALLAERLERMGLRLADYRVKRFAERGYDPSVRLTDGVRMLVGEAAGIDPVTGEGIAQAIEYGALAGRFLADWLERRTPVSAWDAVVKRSRLAIDLRVRRRLVELFYGAGRPGTERFLLRSPNALHVGCQHFAAQRVDRARLADVALRLGLGWLGGAWSGRRAPAPASPGGQVLAATR